MVRNQSGKLSCAGKIYDCLSFLNLFIVWIIWELAAAHLDEPGHVPGVLDGEVPELLEAEAGGVRDGRHPGDLGRKIFWFYFILVLGNIVKKVATLRKKVFLVCGSCLSIPFRLSSLPLLYSGYS